MQKIFNMILNKKKIILTIKFKIIIKLKNIKFKNIKSKKVRLKIIKLKTN
jgi:hypothetical protein